MPDEVKFALTDEPAGTDRQKWGCGNCGRVLKEELEVDPCFLFCKGEEFGLVTGEVGGINA